MQAARRPGYYTPSGAFMGFDSENESSDTEDVERVKMNGCWEDKNRDGVWEDKDGDGVREVKDRKKIERAIEGQVTKV